MLDRFHRSALRARRLEAARDQIAGQHREPGHQRDRMRPAVREQNSARPGARGEPEPGAEDPRGSRRALPVARRDGRAGARATGSSTTARAPPASTPRPIGAPRSHQPSAASAPTAAHGVERHPRRQLTWCHRAPGSARFTDRKRLTNPAAMPSASPSSKSQGDVPSQAVRVVAPDEPDHRHKSPARARSRRVPRALSGSLIPGLRHVKKDTSTLTSGEQAIGSG